MIIQGVMHHQASAAIAAGVLRRGASLKLVAEAGNSHDPHAVSVWNDDQRFKLGYLPRGIAPFVSAQLMAGARNQIICTDIRLPNIEAVLTLDIGCDFKSPTVSPAPGVYCIFNTSNFKIYVGSSNNVRERIDQHWRDLHRGTHFIKSLQHDWNDFGKQKFKYTRLPKKRGNNLEVQEAHYVNIWATHDPRNGYNNLNEGRDLHHNRTLSHDTLSSAVLSNGADFVENIHSRTSRETGDGSTTLIWWIVAGVILLALLG